MNTLSMDQDYENYLRQLMESGLVSSAEQPNALADILKQQAMPQPRYDIAPMQANTMRFENGPDQGRVVPLADAYAQGERAGFGGNSQPRGASANPLPDPVNRDSPNVPGADRTRAPQRMRVKGVGGGIHDLGEMLGMPPQLDYSRPGIEIAGLGKGWYGKDGDVYIKDGNGGLTKAILGYDREGSRNSAMQAFFDNFKKEKAGLDLRRGEQDLQQGDLSMESTRQQMRINDEEANAKRAAANAPVDPNAPMKLTESQGKAMTFGSRAGNSHEILNEVGENGRIQPNLIKRAAEGVPLIGGALGTIANKLPDFGPIGGPSAAQQQVEQAERDFINATLRRESGAVISESEFDNARRQYFPQPGDGPEVIMQKKRNREIVVNSMATEAGPGRRNVISAGEKSRAIARARAAVSAGKSREQVRRRLEEAGITDHGI